ncbi:ADP-ribose pyrophosphatase [Desulfonispora thiosulfatigenes DSM 11270]|uniref:ADP-ribose pyrophosphatase n=1 Tax=Desulfonispora thiosulfatigenes DSM 11270 TaxID=656914 RepID=A0A1W1VPK4_DESTI|nr:NUDIX hydrolase [Desulfonispora thiosulfatigenes]SMB95256.1 ADP-ribose pyrophosphatase [Desulfonispora thiosulfatigenes DSM 11270]
MLTEKTVQEELIFKGKIITVKKLKVKLSNGKDAFREIVEHPGAVCILTLTNENKVILVKQYRKATEETLWEVPAGKLEKDEDPLDCAKRELQEETGYIAEHWEKIGDFYASPGYCNELIHIYFAKELSKGSMNLDEDEILESYNLSIDEVKEIMQKGQIRDIKTQVALQFLLLKVKL